VWGRYKLRGRAVGVHGQRIGLWAWPSRDFTLCLAEGSTYYYVIDYVFSAHFFELSTKFGHSIPRPLDLDSHNLV
jgi:hypothetical protein